MKIKDFFSKINEQGKITAEFIDNLPDAEIPDEYFESFEGAFLTKDRAITDPDVNKKLRAEILNPVDRDILAMLKHLNHPDAAKVESEKSTYNRLAMIGKMLPEVIERASKVPDNEETKKKLQTMKASLEEWETKYNNREREYNEALTKAQKEFENRLSNYQLDSELENISREYIFAEAYEKNRPALQKALLGDLKQKNILQYATKETGEPSIQVLTMGDDGTPRQKFNGNTAVTIKTLLDETFKPYLKVSNGQEPPQTTKHTAPAPDPKIRTGVRTTVQ